MKSLKIIFILLLSMPAVAQEQDVIVCMTDYQILYFGYPNKVLFSTNETPECTECDTIYPTGELNEYIVKPGKEKAMTINFSNGQEVSFRASYLPNPTLFFGMTLNGNKASRGASSLRARYGPEMNLYGKFEVLNWRFTAGEKTFEGSGSKLSDEVKAHLKSFKGIEFISILTQVEGPDGIIRNIGGAYSF